MSKTVLVVDDEIHLRQLISETLAALGLVVLEAKDGDAGLHCSREYSGQIHVLITDIRLPLLSGIELSRHLEAERPELKTVFISGDLLEWLDSGNADAWYLAKPFSMRTLAEKVLRILDAKQTNAPRL